MPIISTRSQVAASGAAIQPHQGPLQTALVHGGRYDADQSYDLPEEGYVTLDPVQPPTAPAYKTALAQKRANRNSHTPG